MSSSPDTLTAPERPATTTTTHGTGIDWLTSWEDAVAESRRTKRPILVDVYQDNCGGCVKLMDVTIADPRVTEAIRNRFVPVSLHLTKDRAITREWQVFWTPTVLFGDRSGKIRYTSPNFLPPEEFLDLLDIGEAMVAMRWQGYDDAIMLLEGLQRRSPEGSFAAEAAYWRGIAAYFKAGKSPKAAHAIWDVDLLPRFPDSVWAKRIP